MVTTFGRSLAWLLFVFCVGVVPIVSLSSCSPERNTTYASGFSLEKFNAVQVGIDEKSLLASLGNPLSVSTHVQYPGGGTNNLSGRRTLAETQGGERIVHFSYDYSAPRDISIDYVVFTVQVNDGRVLSKSRYVTD